METVPKTLTIDSADSEEPHPQYPHLFVTMMTHAMQAPKHCLRVDGQVVIGRLLDDAQALRAHACVVREVDGVTWLLLADEACSRSKHAAVVIEGEDTTLIAYESKNGTWHKDHRLTAGKRIPLRDGDHFTVGRCVLVYRKATEAVAAQIVEPAANDVAPTMRTFVPRLKGVYETLGRGAQPLLIEGDTGVGKEHVAHHHGAVLRPEGPFLSLNCATLKPELAEAELFGTVSGAFTHARNRDGIFMMADGGTLFLDEVAELEPKCQAGLLRVIEEQRVRKLGRHDEVPIDVALVCATNASLNAEVLAGRFRQDLLYRIGARRIRIPSLAERPEDFGLLVAAILRKLRRPQATMQIETARLLMEQAWPGNVRQLENVLDAATTDLPTDAAIPHAKIKAALAAPPPTSPAASPSTSRTPTPAGAPPRRLPALTDEELLAALKRHNGKVGALAKELGRTNTTRIYARLNEIKMRGIDPSKLD